MARRYCNTFTCTGLCLVVASLTAMPLGAIAQVSTASAPNAALQSLGEASKALGELRRIHERTFEISANQGRLFNELDLLASQLAALRNQGTLSQPPGSQGLGDIQRRQSALRAEALRLQTAMQRENTMFNSVSNVLKTRHDTVKNSISNVR